MFREKKEVYLLYGPNSVADMKLMQTWVNNLACEGIQAVSYGINTINDSETGAFIQEIVMVRVREIWHGAFKRFAKKYNKTNLNKDFEGLEVWG